jgi:K+-transporting ATPase A subunit
MRPIERLLYRITFVDENHEMRWTSRCCCSVSSRCCCST